MKEFTTSELIQLAVDVYTAGRRADVFDYWCELGEMIAAFAIQTRGWHFQIPANDEEAWLMKIRHDSACSALCQVCDLVRPRKSAAPWFMGSARALLSRHFKDSTEYDPVASAARLLAQAAVASTDMPSDWASWLTTELFKAVAAIAIEFETSWSPEAARATLARDDPFWSRSPELQRRRAAYLYVRDREPDDWSARLTVGLRGEPAPPSPGEVERALAHCSLLAQGRLVPGPHIRSMHPRYERSSLLLHPALSADEKSIHVLSRILYQHCIGGWWLGMCEDVEFGPHDICRADIAGWRRDRFASDPAGELGDPFGGREPTRHRPDWICDQLTQSTSVQEQQSKQSMYQRAGVPWYWIVDMQNRIVRILRLTGDDYRLELVADGTRRAALPPFDPIEVDLESVLRPRGE